VAKGKVTSRIETGLGLFGLIAIGVTLSIVFKWTPWLDVQDWWKNRRVTLSQPATSWVQRVGNQPDSAGITDRAVIVFQGDFVESRARADGSVLWKKEMDWGALAGAPNDATAVAVVSKVDTKGFEALDPQTGQARWTSPEGSGAWTFRDAVLAVECPKSGCEVVNRAPADGAVRWKVPVAGAPRALAGANSTLYNVRGLDDIYDDARSAVPRTMPRYVGFPVDRKMQVVDTGTGKRLREDEIPKEARAVLIGNRIVYTSATASGGGCRYTIVGKDAASGKEVWRKDGYDLRTAGGAACEPRKDPPGGGVVLIGVRYDGRHVFLSAVDGRELAVAGEGERVEGTDGEYGLIRSVDGKTLKAVSLSRGGIAVWTRQIPPKAKVGMTTFAVFVTDAETERITALEPVTGAVKLDIDSGATVLGLSPDGVVLSRGRAVGWLGFGAVA
jgi:outer membrane protein assembly factor BamB